MMLGHSGTKTSGGTAPLSEPETAAIDDFLMKPKPIVSFSWHARVPMVEDNDMDIADQVAAVYAESSGYPHVNRYEDYPCKEDYGEEFELTGQWIDAMAEKGMAAIDIELSDYYIAEFDHNLAEILAVLDFIDQNVINR